MLQKIRNIRNNRGGGMICWILRIIGCLIKILLAMARVGTSKGKLSSIELFEINNAINNWIELLKTEKIN